MRHHVVIVGGGFGGLYAAKRLAGEDVRVTLVDKQNYHLFQPLLYQVATAGLSPGDIASPIRGILRDAENVTVRMGEVTAIERASKRLVLADGTLEYDTLILATGVRHSYFGHDEWEHDAPGLKTLDDALEIRRRVLLAFEAAERETEAARREPWLTFVVIGAGPTGVELAGAISELARFTVNRDFRHFDPKQTKVVLIEAGSRVLAAFDEALSDKALEALKNLEVDVRLSTRVTKVGAEGIEFEGGQVRAKTVLWAAGVAASPLTKSLQTELDRAGRVKVLPDLTVPGSPEVFVIGDLACVTQTDGSTLPGLCPVAIQQGIYAAETVLKRRANEKVEPFEYFDKGIMATVGRAAGIAQSGRLRLWGFIGWLAWLFIHILYLIGFRNRLLVMVQWAWAWLTYGRSARLITSAPVVSARTGESR